MTDAAGSTSVVRRPPTTPRPTPRRRAGVEPNDYGRVDVEEGAHVYGFGWESNWGTAPVDAFKETTRTAVAKLY